jgi:hypothetical protein
MMKLKRIAAAAAVAAAAMFGTATAAPTEAQADFTEYNLCLINMYNACYPLDAYGRPRPPNMGDPDESEAFVACYVAAQQNCVGLPGDPNG